MGSIKRRTFSKFRGAAAVESLIALPIVALLMLGAAEWARIYEAKTTLNHAAVQGARAGAVDHAQVTAIQSGVARGMLAFYSPQSGQMAQKLAELTASLGTQSQLRILNPTPQAFNDFGEFKDGRRVIPNDDLHKRSKVVGGSSGVNIQDANLLKVETVWGVELRMPFISQVISFIGQASTTPGSFEYQLYSRGMIPISSTTVVRMQSDAWENDLMVSIADQDTQRQQGGPEEQRVTEAAEAPWGESPGYQGSLARNHVPQQLNLENIPMPEGGAAGSDPGSLGFAEGGGGAAGFVPEEEQECKTTWDDPKYAPEKCEGRWYCGLVNLASDIKVAANIIWDFIDGMLSGLKSQAEDLINFLKDPTVLLDLAKSFIEDPKGTLQSIIDSVVDDAEKIINCGPYEIGQIVGENINPMTPVKILSKLAKIGKSARLTRYADDLAKKIACASFTSGTLVWTPNGPVPIETLSIGDLVESRNSKNNIQKAQKITETFNRIAPEYIRLQTEFGTLEATPEHPFWVQGQGWVEAQDLQLEDPIATLNGDTVVLDIDKTRRDVEVFNFSVEETPNYFVSESKAWVHNTKCIVKFEKSTGKNVNLNNPEPNTVYYVDSRHRFETDGQKRTTRVKTRIEDKDLDSGIRNCYQQGKAGACGLPDDEGGHMVATKLGGPGEIVNLVPQNMNLNRSAWKKMENYWAKEAASGKVVEVEIEIIYGDPIYTKRPTEFIVYETIDGTPRGVPYRYPNQAGG